MYFRSVSDQSQKLSHFTGHPDYRLRQYFKVKTFSTNLAWQRRQ